MKHQSFIRSLFVAFCAFFVCVSAMAETYLNPFAYRLDNMVDRNTGITDESKGLLMNDHYVIQYALSGPATSVIVRFWDDNNSTWSRDRGNTGTALATIDITNETDTEGNQCNAKGYHTYTLDFTHIVGKNDSFNKIKDKRLRWTIDVTGGNTPNILEETVNETINVVTSITYKDMNSTKYVFADCDNEKAGSTVDILGKTKKPISYTRINAVKVTAPYTFSYPASVDICDDPYNYNFGAVFCTEANTGGEFNKRGLYVFGGGMEHLKGRWDNGKKEAICYTGPGYNYSDPEKTINLFSDGVPAPHRVRLTENGRLFFTAMSKDNSLLIEYTRPGNADNNNFYECPKEGGDYHRVFTNGTESDNILKYNGSFMAGANCAFDVMGGKNSALKLLLLASTNGNASPSQDMFRIDQYAIGTSNTWSSASNMEKKNNLLYTINQSATYNSSNHNHVLNTVHESAKVMVVAYNFVGMEYDPQGGFWLSQYRTAPAGPLASTMVHRTKNGTWELEEHALNRENGAIRHNHNYQKLAVVGGYVTDTIMHKTATSGNELDASYYNKGGETGKTYTANQLGTEGRAYKCQTARRNQITIYDVAYDNSTGSATLSNPKYINTENMGSCNDFAWDFADNLYVAARTAGKIVAFALPHAADKVVSTPCREVYEYEMAPVHEFSASVNPNELVDGESPCATIIHKRIKGAPYPRYLQNANVTLDATILDGCKLYKWEEKKFDLSTHTNSNAEGNTTNQLVIQSMVEKEQIIAHIGICVYEEEAPLAVQAETTFPAAFVKRELDDISYSTICFPFHLESLVGTPYQGASVLELKSSTVNSDGDSRVFLNFEEVVFGTGQGMRAGKPYLIQLPKGKQLQPEEIFTDVTCPVLSGTNACGGLDVNCGNDITFHGMLNPTTFKKNETIDEITDKLFLTADNRLVSLYGQDSFTINGLRGYFTVSDGMAKTAEFVLNLPEKVTTSIPMVNIADSLKVTKYLWNGQIYIQRGNEVYDLSGARVK